MDPPEHHAPVRVVLTDIRDATDTAAGQKARTLARLAAAGVPVPPGIVVGADAFDRGHLRPDLVEPLRRRTAALLAGGRVIVRGDAHSATDASGADHRDAVTDVIEADWLVEAIEASHRGAGTTGAVVLQRQVRPRTSGTIRRLSRRRGRPAFEIESWDGPIEAMLAGWVDPVRTTVDPASARGRDRALVEAMAAVESALGSGREIEWAVDAQGKLWVLAVRRALPAPRRPAPLAWLVPAPVRIVWRRAPRRRLTEAPLGLGAH
jgi:hypothetical protein